MQSAESETHAARRSFHSQLWRRVSGSIFCIPQILEEILRSFFESYLGRPTQQSLQFFVGITMAFPLGRTSTPIENRRQLALGPVGILLPQSTKKVGDWVGNRNRQE